MEFNIKRGVDGGIGIVEVAGEVDVFSAPEVREAILQTIQDGRHHIIVDLSACSFLDSTGLGVLVGALKRVRSHEGSLRLAGAQEKVQKVFRVTGLNKVLVMHPSLTSAMEAANKEMHQSTSNNLASVGA